ncbi:hypothetical protein OOK31_35810 [Streptomyces sp. NBC_00249]|uniref:hypothetical protein n=1 Tax=Streptomyces sp. NBC_00249 TaxID=2975690 RepID=UPI002254A986|nr:hypothetical protein [Streptomyces sp. NBC_00249]MCX5199188.1 hypothetical protein [Streptomyces sp. NBC_00249]
MARFHLPYTSLLSRLVPAFLAGTALVLVGPSVVAHASETVEIPAATPGGVSLTVRFHGAVVPQPYVPDADDAWGPHKCQLIYHDFDPTPGCGGFKLSATLHHVRDLPGYQAGASPASTSFEASADTARTFRCVRPDGGFDHKDDTVVRTTGMPLTATYYTTSAGYLVQAHRQDPSREFGPQFFVNFPAETVNCPAGTTPSQYGLKVTNLRVSIDDPYVFGSTSWTHPGPFYG